MSSIPDLSAVIVIVLLSLEYPFDRRNWRKAQLPVAGATLPSGMRTVASALIIP